MKNEEHLSEEDLNMYLDGELERLHCERVEAHLAACDVCREERVAFESLSGALAEEDLASSPAPDLVPKVMAGLRPVRRLWLVPSLQAVAALALLGWGWREVGKWWSFATEYLPSSQLKQFWLSAMGWAGAQVEMVNTFAASAWSGIRAGPLVASPLGGLSSYQTTTVVIVLVFLWLAGNGVLLYRAAVNGGSK